MDEQNAAAEQTAWDEGMAPPPPHRLRLRVFLSNRTAVLGAALASLFLVTALLAPLIAPYDPLEQDLNRALLVPDGTFLLGTDPYGRDEFSRIVYGARLSMAIGAVSVSIGMILGVILGLAAGYFGGWIDDVISRVIDVMLAFPSILLAILLIAIIGQGLSNVMIAVGILSVPTYTRLVRGSVIGLKNSEFIEAAIASGSSTARLLTLHILINILGPIIVQSTFLFAMAIRLASGLSFLGIGVPAPTPEWGSMLADARVYISLAPRLIMIPGFALMALIMGFNLFGDGLRDLLDPKMRL